MRHLLNTYMNPYARPHFSSESRQDPMKEPFFSRPKAGLTTLVGASEHPEVKKYGLKDKKIWQNDSRQMENRIKLLLPEFCGSGCVWTSAEIQLQQSKSTVVQGTIERFEVILGTTQSHLPKGMQPEWTCCLDLKAPTNHPSIIHPCFCFFFNLKVKLGGSQITGAKHSLLLRCSWCPRQAVILLQACLSLCDRKKGDTFNHQPQTNYFGHGIWY